MSEKPHKYVEHVKALFGLHREEHPNLTQPASSDQPASQPAPAAATGAPPPQPQAQSQAQPQSQPQGTLQSFDDRLKQFASSGGAQGGLVAGRVHMLNIDNVRERMGKRWSRFSDRVHQIIKTELKIRLGPRDMFSKVDANSYVIVFGDCSEVEARLRVALLSEQILEKLLGEAEAKDLQALGVQRLVTKADGTVAAEALESTESLVALFNEAEKSGEKADSYDMEDVAVGRRALTPEEVAALMGEVDDQLEHFEDDGAGGGAPKVKIDGLRSLMKQMEELEQGMLAKAPAFGPLPDKEKADSQRSLAQKAQPMLRRIRQAKDRAEKRIVFLYDRDPNHAERAGAEVSLRVDFAYQPLWHAPSKKVGIYVCNGAVLDDKGRPMELPDVDKDQKADFLAIVDRLALRRVRDDVTKTRSKGLSNVMMVPVHFSTLHRHGSGASFVELCNTMPDEVRKVLSWEIRGSHVDSWSMQLPAVIEPIRRFGRAMFLRLDKLSADFPRVRRNLPYLRAAGVHAVGIDVGALSGSESEKLDFMERLAELAEKSGLKCYGHGFDSLSMTICAVCMGYQHVSGPAIAPPPAEPEGIRATAMENIYGQLLFKEAPGGEASDPTPASADSTAAE